MIATSPWTGGLRLLVATAVLGALGLCGAAVGFAFDQRRALFGYLWAWTYWSGIAMASLLLLAIWHASSARWPVVIRRVLETLTTSVWVLAVLFVPIALGADELYLWQNPPPGLDKKLFHVIVHQRPYLNLGFFVARTALYFALCIGVAEVLLRLSRSQDRNAALPLTTWQRRIGSAAIPALGFALSFASVDWVMSLEPTWASSIFGLYFFAGCFVSAVALLSLASAVPLEMGLPGRLMNASHRASLGKFLLAFTAFWFYLAFDQYMLVWIANRPTEVHWFKVRTFGGWRWVAITLVAVRFVLPMLALLSRELKKSRGGLAAVAAWLLAAHALEVYWMILPAVDVAGMQFHWADAASFVGIGGSAAAFVIWRLRGERTMPIGDPYFHKSLQYAGK